MIWRLYGIEELETRRCNSEDGGWLERGGGWYLRGFWGERGCRGRKVSQSPKVAFFV
jgi:hypothetical protein